MAVESERTHDGMDRAVKQCGGETIGGIREASNKKDTGWKRKSGIRVGKEKRENEP